MGKTPLSVSSPADILAYVLHTLGFTPQDSFVFLTMHGKRVGATLRLDAPGDEVSPAQYTATVQHYLAHDREADGVLFIAYTDRVTIDGTKPYSEHSTAIDTALDHAGTPIRDSWLVTSEHWETYFCQDPDCCTPRPLDEVTDSMLNAHLIYEGSNPTAGTITIPDYTGNTTQTLDRIGDIITGWTITDPADWSAPVMTECRALWQETLGVVPDEDTALHLIAALHAPAVRDRIIADTISTDDDPDTFAEVVIGRYPGRPDWDRVDATHDLLAGLLSSTPPEARAPLFAFLGWIHWYKGRSSIAAQYLTTAQDTDREHRLTQLLTQLVNTGTLPACVTSKDTAYQR
ncbi:DUF4192 domain-containing protein [Arthrobacter sp. EH-1B-1]|uniref:DUF4192 domain-containing protein n=1 Tax=Arthrobacter vasquezii TaxID=2977629 RepID=A0ABT6CYL9_9MICC|nr:DUF4192 domain-containing protein [Arthrobacter vasquezii]MDF9279099.1 DUF4192 domain-containing protein [Arthrobacter vasquezii]